MYEIKGNNLSGQEINSLFNLNSEFPQPPENLVKIPFYIFFCRNNLIKIDTSASLSLSAEHIARGTTYEYLIPIMQKTLKVEKKENGEFITASYAPTNFLVAYEQYLDKLIKGEINCLENILKEKDSLSDYVINNMKKLKKKECLISP